MLKFPDLKMEVYLTIGFIKNFIDMSCYLNIYLVPKSKEENKEAKPLFLTQFSRNSDVYSCFEESVAVPYMGIDENKEVYSQLTSDDMRSALGSIEGMLTNMKDRIATLYKIIEKSYNEDLKNDIVDTESYIKELEETKSTIEKIKFIVDECGEYSDFEKVVVNKG